MQESENWNQDKQDEVIEGGRKTGVAWVKDELKLIAESYIAGDTSGFDSLLTVLGEVKLDVINARSTHEYLDSWGQNLGKEQAKLILGVIYGETKPTQAERAEAMASAARDLALLVERKFEWPEVDGFDVYGVEREDAVAGIPKLDSDLLRSYKNGKPAGANFWTIQEMIMSVWLSSSEEQSLDELVAKLSAQGLENEAKFLPRFAEKAKTFEPFFVLLAMYRSWERFGG